MGNIYCGNFYRGDYIGFSVPIPTLPQSIVIEGTLLTLKSSFHVTILEAMGVMELMKEKGKELSQSEIEDLFCEVSTQHQVSFESFKAEFRFIKKDERASVVIMCTVKNIQEFFDALSEKLGVDIPLQPTHVTLYTKQIDVGIGISSFNEMVKAKDVTKEVPKEIRNAFQYFNKA